MLPPLAPGVTPGTNGLPDGWLRLLAGAVEDVGGPAWRLADAPQAGAHHDGTASFWLSRSPDSPLGQTFNQAGSDGAVRDITVSLPPGVLADPNAVPKCASHHLRQIPTTCPPNTQVGVLTIFLNNATGVFPVYNVEPRRGRTAEMIISGAAHQTGSSPLAANVPIVASSRTDSDFGIDTLAVQLPAGFAVLGQTITIWGVPWAASNDRYRPVAGYCGAVRGDGTNAYDTPGMSPFGLPGGFGGGCSQAGVPYDPTWGPIKPFFVTQTECSDSNPITRIHATNWHTDVTATEHAKAAEITGCKDLPFDPDSELEPSSKVADSASGLSVELDMPQNNQPPHHLRFNPDDDSGAPAHWRSEQGLATAHLKDTVVTLPEGMSVNPSAAPGLEGCTDDEIGVRGYEFDMPAPTRFNNEDPFDGKGVECPDGSKIGTVLVKSPVLDETLTGDFVLGTPESTNPESGQMFRLFLVIRNK